MPQDRLHRSFDSGLGLEFFSQSSSLPFDSLFRTGLGYRFGKALGGELALGNEDWARAKSVYLAPPNQRARCSAGGAPVGPAGVHRGRPSQNLFCFGSASIR